ncbi:hypothetical protein D5266_09390, partial [bacterium c-19]|nr:hypothetical protein [bacterium c-19]
MWKKLLICLSTLAVTYLIGHIYFNSNVDAAPSSAQYYLLGDVFDRNNQKNQFQMHGETWWYVVADQTTKKAYITSFDGAANQCTSMGINAQITSADVGACTLLAQSDFSANSGNDEMGELIERNSANNIAGNVPILPTYGLYNAMTKNELNISGMPGSIWLSEIHNGKRVGFSKRGGNASYKLPSYSYLFTQEVFPEAQLQLYFEIELPQKNLIRSISATPNSKSLTYNNIENEKDKKIADINTTSGEGPYHFYVYDTDTGGSTGSFKNPSAHFDITTNSTNGKAEVTMKNKLPVGNYYFKVKVIDESTNQRLYYSPDNFELDKFRSKETGVIHVEITKESPEITFDINDKGTTYVKGDALSIVTHSEHATHNHPEKTADDVGIEYSVLSATPGLLVSGLPYTSVNAGDGPTLTFAS